MCVSDDGPSDEEFANSLYVLYSEGAEDQAEFVEAGECAMEDSGYEIADDDDGEESSDGEHEGGSHPAW